MTDTRDGNLKKVWTSCLLKSAALRARKYSRAPFLWAFLWDTCIMITWVCIHRAASRFWWAPILSGAQAEWNKSPQPDKCLGLRELNSAEESQFTFEYATLEATLAANSITTEKKGTIIRKTLNDLFVKITDNKKCQPGFPAKMLQDNGKKSCKSMIPTIKLRNPGITRKSKIFPEVKRWPWKDNFWRKNLKNEETKKQDYSIWNKTSGHFMTAERKQFHEKVIIFMEKK